MPRSQRAIVGLIRLMVRVFFRSVEVTGVENVPADRGGVLVSWHPNGMLDPGLILATFPGRIVFGARHGLFRVPLLGPLMRTIGTVPIYRAHDTANMEPEARRAANQESLDALAGEVARGSFASLFPEGQSHDEPHLLELKTGVARFYYRARQIQEGGRVGPVILPVGLYYDSKRSFRSNVLVAFHPPLEIPPELDVVPSTDEAEDAQRERNRALTSEVDRVLQEVIYATEDWETHHLMHRIRKLMRAERACRAGADPGPTDMREKVLAFARVWAGAREVRETQPRRLGVLFEGVRAYDADLRALGLEDHDLDRNPDLSSPDRVIGLFLRITAVYVLLPPVLLFGYVVNLPVAVILWTISKLKAKQKKDEASLKLMWGAVAFPVTWLFFAYLAYRSHPRLHEVVPQLPEAPLFAAVATVVLAMAGALAAVRYTRLVEETARSIRVSLTRARCRRSVARLREERARLFERVTDLAQGVELPGTIDEEGRVVG